MPTLTCPWTKLHLKHCLQLKTLHAAWLCKECDNNQDLVSILNIASNKVKEQISCVLSSLNTDNDELEELIESFKSSMEQADKVNNDASQ